MALKVLEKLARGRTYHVAGISTLEALPAELGRPSGKFVLFIAVDGTKLTDVQITHVAQYVLNLGLCYLCVWGPDCERIHDLFDHVIVQNRSESIETVIMTTWHDEDSLSEAVWFFRYCAEPADAHAPQCCHWIAVAIDNPEWANQIEEALVHPVSPQRFRSPSKKSRNNHPR